MENKEFYLQHDGLKIHCKLDFPDVLQTPEDKCPLLILEHGLTGHMEERHILGIAGHMVSLGFAVLRVELYGHGKSEGAFRDHTVLKWVDQMLTVVDFASSQPFVTNLYLAGHSQGGLTTMLVGALEKDRLKAIVPLAPAIVIWDGARKGMMFGAKLEDGRIPDEVTMPNGRTFGSNYFRTARLLPVEEAIRCYDKPVLIVHADTDESVPVQYALDAAEAYQNCTLKIVEGDTHCYDRHLDRVCQIVGEFLTEMER